MTMTPTTRIDELTLFDRLAAAMNADPDRYEHLGDIDLDLALLMRRPDGDAFRVLLGFRGIACETVTEIDEGAESSADCWLEGDLDDWTAMFADIEANGHATGEWTLNTLTLMGERLRLQATDPMGWDKFHRFNQTLQEFFDAAGSHSTEEVTDARA
jgi:hypothetical protein